MILILLVLLGLVIGSFISAVTYRMPRRQQFIKGKSFCDSCKKELKWYDNVPLFSFLYYGGVSRCCGKKISIRYPLIELASAVGIVIVWLNFHSLLFVILFFLTLTILIIDFEHQIIPDELSWSVLLLVFLIVLDSQAKLFSGLFSGFLFASVFLSLHLITKGRGMGLGDVKLAIPFGLMLGLQHSLTWFMVSFILGGIVSLFLLLLKRANMKTKLAFGPFMIVAFWITLFFTK